MRQGEDRRDEAPRIADLLAILEAVSQEVSRLRKTLLKQGHAQELFQGQMQEELLGLARKLERPDSTPQQDLPAEAGLGSEAASLTTPQLRSLLEFDRALFHLLRLADGGEAPSAPPMAPDAPRSLAEGLDMLRIRVRNLQRSFGLEPIPAVGHPFDDRYHEAHSFCHRPDLPVDQVVEELLPGYCFQGQVVRPALVIVNQNR